MEYKFKVNIDIINQSLSPTQYQTNPDRGRRDAEHIRNTISLTALDPFTGKNLRHGDEFVVSGIRGAILFREVKNGKFPFLSIIDEIPDSQPTPEPVEYGPIPESLSVQRIINQEDFDVPDGTTAEQLGYLRHTHESHSSGLLEVIDGSIRYASPGSNALFFFPERPRSGVVQIEFGLKFLSSTNNALGVVWNLSETENTFFTFRYRGTTGGWELARMDNNTPTNEIRRYEFTPTIGQTYSVRILSTEGNIDVWVDDSLVIEYNHTLPNNGKIGAVGIRGTGVAAEDESQGPRISNVVVSAGFERFELWRQTDQGGAASPYFTYRIPSIVRTKSYLVAASEGRYNSASDDEPMDIVSMRAPLSNVRSWESGPVIHDNGAENGGRTSNPIFLYDDSIGENGKLFCFWDQYPTGIHATNASAGLTGNTATVWYRTSVDEGATWSEAIEITSQVKLSTWSSMYCGPGNGLKMSNGRYVFALAHKIPSESNIIIGQCVYSDDGGLTWSRGADFTVPPEASQEHSLVELSNGNLLITVRSPGDGRLFAISEDGGETISELRRVPAMDTTVIHHSLYRIADTPVVLSVQPNSMDARITPILRVSFDEGENWDNKALPTGFIPGGLEIETDGMGYSALASATIDGEQHVVAMFEHWPGTTNLYRSISVAYIPFSSIGVPG